MRKLIFYVVLFLGTLVSKAQDLESILLASGEDANKLTEAYIKPAMKGLIYGMNNGWYHTAKVHKNFGFDLTIGLNASKVPTEDEIFSFSDLNLANVTSTSLTTPTVAGSGDGATINVSASIDYNGETQTASTTFDMPSGVKDDLPINAIPTPAIQLGVGLPLKLDLMLRLVPKLGSEDVEGSLFGVGLKKEITSIFGPMNKTPLHVSLLAAYTSMGVDYAMDGDILSGQNQRAEFKLNSFTAQAIASLNFPIINFYGGIGYSGGSSTLKMLGTYNLDYTISGGTFDGQQVTVPVTDPIDMEFNAGGFTANLGIRLSLGFFKIFGNYTLQEYNTLSAGIAFSFR